MSRHTHRPRHLPTLVALAAMPWLAGVAAAQSPSLPAAAGASLNQTVQPAKPPPIPLTMQNVLVRLVGLLPVGDRTRQQAAVADLLGKLTADGKWFVARNEVMEVYAYVNPTDPLDQLLLVAYPNATAITAPPLFRKEVMDRLGSTQFRDVILSYALKDQEVKRQAQKADDKLMPAGLRALMDRSYFKAAAFEFKGGMQLSSNVTLSGVFNDLLVVGMGVSAPQGAPQFVLKAGMALNLPSQPDTKTPVDRARSEAEYGKTAAEFLEAEKKKDAAKAKNEKVEPELPEFFAELQMGPGVKANGPLGMSNLQLENGTFIVGTEGPKLKTVGYQGNVNIQMPGGRRSFLGFFEGPIDGMGAMDVLELTVGLATPTLGLGDMAYLSMFAFVPSPASPAARTGGPLGRLQPLKDALSAMYEPLNAVQIKNPGGVPAYVSGGEFPEPGEFNLVVLGPLAKMGDTKGPLVRLAGDGEVLGANFGKLEARLSESGLVTAASASLSLTPVRGVTVGAMTTALDVKVDARDQRARLNGSMSVAGVGRSADINLEPRRISFLSKPQGAGNCVVPLDIQASYDMPNAGDLAKFKVTNILSGVNWPGPDALTGSAADALKGCGGFIWAELQKAGKLLGKGGKIVADGAEEAAKEAAKVAEATAKATKQAAEAAGRASAAAAKATARAAAGAADSAAKAAAQAANVVAGGARDLFSDPGKAISSWAHGSDEPECNRRHRILLDRQREADRQRIAVGFIPSNSSIDDFARRVILPTLGADAKVDAYVNHIRTFDANLQVASASLLALQQQWNSPSGAGRFTLPPSTAGSVIGDLLEQKLANKRVPGRSAGRNSLDRLSATMSAVMTAQKFNEWLGFRQIAEGYDRGQLSQGPAQAYRCARDHAADIPIRLARDWGTFLPTSNVGGGRQTREQVVARETSPADYRNVIAGLETRVNEHLAGIDASMKRYDTFSSAWLQTAAQLVADLRVRMEGTLTPEARSAMADPAKAAQLSKEIAAWERATDGLGDVLNGLLVYPADRRLAVFDVAFYRQKHEDLRSMTDDAATNHWLNHGMSEGRQSSSSFSIQHYWDGNADVRQAYGNKVNALNHWFDHGQREGRSPLPDRTKGFPSTPNAAAAADLVKQVMDAANALNKRAAAP